MKKVNDSRMNRCAGERGKRIVVTEIRTGSGTTVSIREGYIADRPFQHGVMGHGIACSPSLKEWFAEHDDLIDRLLYRDALIEHARLVREHKAYLRRKTAQKKGGR